MELGVRPVEIELNERVLAMGDVLTNLACRLYQSRLVRLGTVVAMLGGAAGCAFDKPPSEAALEAVNGRPEVAASPPRGSLQGVATPQTPTTESLPESGGSADTKTGPTPTDSVLVESTVNNEKGTLEPVVVYVRPEDATAEAERTAEAVEAAATGTALASGTEVSGLAVDLGGGEDNRAPNDGERRVTATPDSSDAPVDLGLENQDELRVRPTLPPRLTATPVPPPPPTATPEAVPVPAENELNKRLAEYGIVPGYVSKQLTVKLERRGGILLSGADTGVALVGARLVYLEGVLDYEDGSKLASVIVNIGGGDAGNRRIALPLNVAERPDLWLPWGIPSDVSGWWRVEGSMVGFVSPADESGDFDVEGIGGLIESGDTVSLVIPRGANDAELNGFLDGSMWGPLVLGVVVYQ